MAPRRQSVGAIRTVWLAALLQAGAAFAAAGDPASPAGRLYAAHCASCHDQPTGPVPSTTSLGAQSADSVVVALTVGTMKAQAAGMTALEIAAVATYLTGQAPARPTAGQPEKNPCESPAGAVAIGTAQWNGWGRDLDNSRYQPEPAIRAADVPRLALHWAYGFHSSVVYGQPTVVDGRLFVPSSAGRVYALDARSGCTYWTYDAGAAVGSAIVVGEFAAPRAVFASKKARRRDRNAHIDISKPPSAVFFGDEAGYVYALDAQHGTLLWKTQADGHPWARISGGPVVFHDRLYIPVASSEEPAAEERGAGCCTFRGSVVAMELSTGRIVWKHYMIADEAKPFRNLGAGAQQFGPAGAAVWSAPTIDIKRGLLYAATGESYSSLVTPGTDAVVALDLEDGRLRWTKQLAPHDPAGKGPAVRADFGSSPILRNLPNGRQILLAGQRSGVVFGLDPDLGGEILWQTQVGAGAVEWGPAADHRNVYVAVAALTTPVAAPAPVTPLVAPAELALGAAPADATTAAAATASVLTAGGLTALDMHTGKARWLAPAPAPVCSWGVRNCIQAQPQAVTVMPGIAFAGALDGHLRAYSTIDGKVVWDFDTAKEFSTVNGLRASGGSLDDGGPTIVKGMVYVNSGFGRRVGQPGNVLLAFSVDGK